MKLADLPEPVKCNVRDWLASDDYAAAVAYLRNHLQIPQDEAISLVDEVKAESTIIAAAEKAANDPQGAVNVAGIMCDPNDPDGCCGCCED